MGKELVHVPRDLPEKSTLEQALERLDEAIRFAAAVINESAIPDGHISAVSSWAVVVDERFWDKASGRLLGAAPDVIASEGNPSYMVRGLVTELARRRGWITEYAEAED